jgi:hypothetical protein
MRQAFALILAVPLLLLVAVLGASGAVPAGGVQGIVKQPEGGMCPADDPCDGIGRNVLLVFSRTGQKAHRVRSDSTGHYKLRLAPGRYAVHAVVPAARTTPSTVLVPKRGFARATITVIAFGQMP